MSASVSSPPSPLPPWLRWGVVGSVVLAIAGGAFWQYGRPERQIRAHTQRLLRAVEQRNWDQVEMLVSEAYSDGWGLNKQRALAYSREIFGQFFRLRLQPQALQVQLDLGDPSRQGQATLWFVIEGSGGPLANLTRDQVNALEQPFRLNWQRRGGEPFRWELTRVENPELQLPPLPAQEQTGQR